MAAVFYIYAIAGIFSVACIADFICNRFMLNI